MAFKVWARQRRSSKKPTKDTNKYDKLADNRRNLRSNGKTEMNLIMPEMAIIYLRPYLGERALSYILSDFLDTYADQFPSEVQISFQRLLSIRPEGVTLLSNTLHWLHEQGVSCLLTDLHNQKFPIQYLDDSKFFEQHIGACLRENAQLRPTTLPLQQVVNADSYAWINLNLVPWLSYRTGYPEEAFYPIAASMSELFANIVDHTEYDIGSVFVQHYLSIGNEGTVQISIADYGGGIPASVRKVDPSQTDDFDAIVQATQYGFTSQSLPTNRGAGLDQLLQSVVLETGGTVIIYSSQGIVQFNRKNGAIVPDRPFTEVGYCPGTTISLSIPIDGITLEIDEEENEPW